jgi:major membrane immunogen (membrane-anchored lipoprotein)
MADQKISQLPLGTLLPQTIFPIVTLGTTSQTTFGDLTSALSLVISGVGTTITAMTFNQGTYDLTVDQNDGTSFTQSLGILSSDMTVTGGTYDMMTGIVEFTNNSGGTFSVTGFAVGATDTVITNVSFDPVTKFLTIDDSAGSSFVTLINDFNGLNVIGGMSATTFYGDGSQLTGIAGGGGSGTIVTGGTYSNGTATFTNSTGGTFNVTGFFTPSNDVFVSAMTFNNGTYDLIIDQTDGSSFTQNFGILATDMTVTGGTYDFNTGVVEFTNNSGGTFSVSGFSSGLTDSTIANFTYNNANKFTITDTTGGTFNASFNTVTGLTVTGSLSATTFYGDGSNLTGIAGGASVFTVGSGGTLSIKANNPTTNAVGNYSFASNYNTTTRGNYSVAQNEGAYSLGQGSHAEGRLTKAVGIGSHAEGNNTYAGDKYFTVLSASGKSLIIGPTNIDFSADFNPAGGYIISDAFTSYQYTGFTYSAPKFTLGLAVTGFSGTRVVDNSFRTSLLTPLSSGAYSHAEGSSTKAIGGTSHAEGSGSIAYGQYSHAEGAGTVASGNTSHAEGYSTRATGNYSHAEGYYTNANGYYSHVEGTYSLASGTASHAEGWSTTASGDYSHAEGFQTQARNYNAHAEGYATTASGQSSHSEGYYTIAGGEFSHAEGYNTKAMAWGAHAEGYGATAYGRGAHAENNAWAFADSSHAEGYSWAGLNVLPITSTIGNAILVSNAIDYSSSFIPYGDAIIDGKRYAYSAVTYSNPNFIIFLSDDVVLSYPQYIADISNPIPFDNYTYVIGSNEHAEGSSTIAMGYASHAEGAYTLSSGNNSHAEGSGSIASGVASHAEGAFTIASGEKSHAEGATTIASGNYSHAEGATTQAKGQASHAGGQNSIAEGATAFVHSKNSLVSASRSAILGGQNITGFTNDTVYVPDFVITKVAAVPTSSADSIGEPGSITWDANYFYWKTQSDGWLRVTGSTF